MSFGNGRILFSLRISRGNFFRRKKKKRLEIPVHVVVGVSINEKSRSIGMSVQIKYAVQWCTGTLIEVLQHRFDRYQSRMQPIGDFVPRTIQVCPHQSGSLTREHSVACLFLVWQRILYLPIIAKKNAVRV